jgi:hypothetical protein
MLRANSVAGTCLILTLAFLALRPSFSMSQDFDLTGDVRMRLRFVDSAHKSPVYGTYGEALTRGFSLKHRFLLQVSYPVAGSVTVGGLVRVSNEDENVLLSGPEYLSSKFGSAFAEYETPAVSARFGYYDIYYTPLTLMRWDVDDDPEGGGGACPVCPGTPGVAGTILGGSLEELGPILTFEGLKTEVTGWDALGCNTFFAKSTVLGETYDVLTYGGRAAYTRYIQRSSSLLSVAVIAVRSEEDRRSKEQDLISTPKPFRNAIGGIAWDIPISKRLGFQGEWTYSHSDDQTDRQPDISGNGAVSTLVGSLPWGLRAEASYIYLSPNWDSYFRALSYTYNRRGPRLRLEIARGRLFIALFGKYLTTIDPAAVPSDLGGPPRTIAYPTLSARAYVMAAPGLNLGLAAIMSGEGPEKDGFTLDTSDKRTTLLGTVTYDFGKASSLTLEERYIWNDFEEAEDYGVSVLSLYVRAGLW